ncbi:MAG: hypothetical protein AB7V39_00490 [Nitrospiraceae bacterium]
MAFNFGSGLGGAAQGASAGAAFGPIGAGIGGLVGGVAGGLFGKKKKRTPDYTPLINAINQSGANQRGLITGLRPKLEPLSTQFKTDRSGLGQNFISQAGDASGALSRATVGAGRQQILESVPEETQNLREAIASSGTNRGGTFLALKAKQDQERGRSIGNLTTEANIENLRSKQGAIRDVFGLDADTQEKLFASGRQDLIDEMNNLLQEEQNRTSALGQIYGMQINNQFASDLAGDRQKQGLLETILGGVGGVAGGLAQNKLNDRLFGMLGGGNKGGGGTGLYGPLSLYNNGRAF